MIRQDEAKKAWKSDTPVIRKGDKGWRSDHPDRFGESYGTNPMTGVRMRAVDSFDDRVGRKPGHVGDMASYEEGADLVYVIAREMGDGGLVWRHRYRYRNAVHRG